MPKSLLNALRDAHLISVDLKQRSPKTATKVRDFYADQKRKKNPVAINGTPPNINTLRNQPPTPQNTLNYQGALNQNPVYQRFQQEYNQTPPFERQLADLTGTSLENINSPRIPLDQKYSTLDLVNLLKTPYSQKGERMDYYNPNMGPQNDEQRITISPAPGGNPLPIPIFNHEAKHAIDDTYKRPHQNEIIKLLVHQEKNAKIRNGGKGNRPPQDIWLNPLLSGAQNIIDNGNFKTEYPYEFFANKINAGFNSLSRDATGKPLVGVAPVTKFKDADRVLAQERLADRDPLDAFMGLSEFPAFMMEELNNPWNVAAPTATQPERLEAYENSKDSRKFLKENLRTSYRDYNNLVGASNPPETLQADYPLVHNAFYDRYNNLRTPQHMNQNNVLTGKLPLNAANDVFPAPKYNKGGTVNSSNQNDRAHWNNLVRIREYLDNIY